MNNDLKLGKLFIVNSSNGHRFFLVNIGERDNSVESDVESDGSMLITSNNILFYLGRKKIKRDLIVPLFLFENKLIVPSILLCEISNKEGYFLKINKFKELTKESF